MHPFVFSLASMLLVTGLQSAEAEPSELSQSLQRALAERFAPVLVFHEAEEFLPSSPFFPLDLAPRVDNDSGSQPGPSVIEILGDADSRTDLYRSMSRPQRADMARVFFHVYPRVDGGEWRVVVEYWLYYAQNIYQARGGIFPVRVDTSHPNDMEHIVMILTPADESADARDLPERAEAYAIHKILASAHHGSLPTNTYTFPPGGEARVPPTFLVELGSHANAADIDGDGRFERGVDSSAGGKFIWGIRDNGMTWAAYNPAYMDARGGGNAVVLSPPREGSAEGTEASGYSYGLEQASSLASTFERLALSEAEVDQAFQVPVAWPKKVFGRSNGSADELLIPSNHENFGNPQRLENGYASLNRGLAVGYTNILYAATFFVGARYAWIVGSRIIPDVVAEGQVLVTAEGNDYYEVELLGYYPIDTISRVFAGASLITDDIRFDKRQYDFIGGIEFELSSFRFRTAYRTTGSVSQAQVDFRLYYFLF